MDLQKALLRLVASKMIKSIGIGQLDNNIVLKIEMKNEEVASATLTLLKESLSGLSTKVKFIKVARSPEALQTKRRRRRKKKEEVSEDAGEAAQKEEGQGEG